MRAVWQVRIDAARREPGIDSVEQPVEDRRDHARDPAAAAGPFDSAPRVHARAMPQRGAIGNPANGYRTFFTASSARSRASRWPIIFAG